MFFDNSLIGTIITIYMVNGHSYSGALRENKENSFSLLTPNGKCYTIINFSLIEAYSYEVGDNNKIIKEKDPKTEKPEHIPGDIKSLVELKKAQAKSDLAEIRRQLKLSHTTAEKVEYGSQLQSLSAFKKHTEK